MDQVPMEVPSESQPQIPPSATRPAAPSSTAPPKTYVVQRGENLGKIARIVYGRSSPEVINYLVDANRGRIKDRDSLREGQTILTPPLPADIIKRWGVTP